jgi:hypothetical protein
MDEELLNATSTAKDVKMNDESEPLEREEISKPEYAMSMQQFQDQK